MKTWQRRTIGILTLGGSATGFVIVLQELFNGAGDNYWLIILLAALILYGFGVFVGVMIFEDHDRMRQFALPFWALQIPYLTSAWLSFEFSSGARFILALTEGASIEFYGGAGSRFSFYLANGAPFSIGVNFVAIVIFQVFVDLT